MHWTTGSEQRFAETKSCLSIIARLKRNLATLLWQKIVSRVRVQVSIHGGLPSSCQLCHCVFFSSSCQLCHWAYFSSCCQLCHWAFFSSCCQLCHWAFFSSSCQLCHWAFFSSCCQLCHWAFFSSSCQLCHWAFFSSCCGKVRISQRTHNGDIPSKWLSCLPGNERPSGRLFSERLRPCGSCETRMPAEAMAQATRSFRAWCLAGLPGPSDRQNHKAKYIERSPTVTLMWNREGQTNPETNSDSYQVSHHMMTWAWRKANTPMWWWGCQKSRDGRIVIFCRIPNSVNRRLISGRFRIINVTLPLVYTYKILQQIASNAVFFCNL